MRNLLVILTALTLLTVQAVHAHGPTRQKVSERISIDAPPAAVWQRIRDFGAMQGWHPAVESTELTGASGEVGAVRTLHLKGGGTVVEELTRYSDAEQHLAYKMKDPGPIPVSNYSATLAVAAGENGGSVVEWRGAFYRAFPNNNPPPDQNDEAAIAAVTGVYQSGLANLKKVMEAK